MNPIVRTATVLSFVAAGFAGCSSTSVALKEKWRDPAAPDGMMKKALVLAVHEEIWMQAKFEREMQARLKEHGVETIAAVDVLKSNEKLTRERFAKTFADLGIDAVVVSRVAGVKEDITIAAPTYTIDQAIMKGFYSYYDYAYMSALNPSEIKTSRVSIETTVYGTAGEGNRVWVGTSDALRFEDAADLIDDVSAAVVRQLAEERLLPR